MKHHRVKVIMFHDGENLVDFLFVLFDGAKTVDVRGHRRDPDAAKIPVRDLVGVGNPDADVGSPMGDIPAAGFFQINQVVGFRRVPAKTIAIKTIIIARNFSS